VPPKHALSKRKSIRLKQLTKHPLVIRESGSGIRHCFEESLKKSGLSLADFRVALQLGSNEAIKEAVLQGVGMAILSTYAVQRELKARNLYALEIRDLHCEREMYVVSDKRRVLPLPARLFLHYLDSHPVQPTVP